MWKVLNLQNISRNSEINCKINMKGLSHICFISEYLPWLNGSDEFMLFYMYITLKIKKKKKVWVFCLKASPNCLLSLWILLKMLFYLRFLYSPETISKLYNLTFQDPNLIFPTSLQHELSFRGLSLLSFKTKLPRISCIPPLQAPSPLPWSPCEIHILF